MILSIIWIVLLAAAAVIAYRQYHNILGVEVAEGRISALEPREGSEGGTTYVLVAEFFDREGNRHNYRSGFSSSSAGYKVGDKIRIYFKRGNPSDCGVLSFGYRFGAAWILACVGLCLLLIQIGYAAGNNWFEKNIPTTIISRGLHR